MALSPMVSAPNTAPEAPVAGRLQPLRRLRDGSVQSITVFLRDVGQGLLEVSHNTLALIGLVLAAVTLFAAGRADVRTDAETWALGWLQARHEARAEPSDASSAGEPVDPLIAELSEPDAIARATASDPKALSRQQAAVANWLARRYHVAPEPLSRLVEEAWSVGQKAKLDPTLILAIMAVESSFNPFAQSAVGAQGLMQVMTKIHNDKYEAFGGNHAAFDPVTNLRVGVQVLRECISRAGSLDAGLRFYVGAANLTDDGGYAGKVLSEQNLLRLVASGKNVPAQRPIIVATPSPVPGPVPGQMPGTVPTAAKPDAAVEATPASEPPHAPEQVALLLH